MTMTGAMTAEDDGPQRLHGTSPLFVAGKAARGLVVPAFLVLFASGGVGFPMWPAGGLAFWLWATVVIVGIAVRSLLPYLIFRYTLADDELVITDGILTRTVRHIPYARIQNIDLVQNPVHRVCGVALVRVETASGGKPEAVIRVLSCEAVDRMRARVFAGRAVTGHVAVDAAPGEGRTAALSERRLLLRLPTRELVKLGIASNKGMIVVGAAVGVAWQLELDWFGRAEGYLGSGREWLGRLAGGPILGGILIGTVALALGLILLRVLSIGWYVFQLHGFTLTRVGDDLRAEYGLLNRISRTVPRVRIQALEMIESPLHRVFRRQSVRLQTVGGGLEAEMDLEGRGGGTSERQWLAPMIEPARVPALLGEAHEGVALAEVDWQPISRRAWRRVFKLWAGLGLLATVSLTVAVSPWLLALLVPVTCGAYAHARLYARHSAYALAPWGLVFRSGWLSRTLILVRYAKIQTVATEESPFDRRNGMAAVRVDTAGAEVMAHTIEIPYLDAPVAAAVARRLYEESSALDFRW